MLPFKPLENAWISSYHLYDLSTVQIYLDGGSLHLASHNALVIVIEMRKILVLNVVLGFLNGFV